MKIAFLGDLAFIGEYTYLNNGEERIKLLAEHLSTYDYVVANLETPLTNVSSTTICKSMHLKADPNNIDLLKKLHIDSVTLGNNHICDYEFQGLEDTIEILNQNGIGYFGVNNKDLILERDNEKISFSGFCCYSANGAKYLKGEGKGINALTYDNIVSQLEKDKKRSCLSILSFHWGDEHTNYPNRSQAKLAHKIAEIKDVLIHGHHTHTVQGIEEIDNSLVAYSLGNFCFDDCTSPFVKNFTVKKSEANRETFVLAVEIINNQIVDYKTVGVYDDKNKGLIFKDISKKMKKISSEIKNCSSEHYQELRNKQIAEIRNQKFQKHDLKWFLSKMNYYSIGSRLGTYVNKIRSKRALKIPNY